jgi:hypothetical protein
MDDAVAVRHGGEVGRSGSGGRCWQRNHTARLTGCARLRGGWRAEYGLRDDSVVGASTLGRGHPVLLEPGLVARCDVGARICMHVHLSAVLVICAAFIGPHARAQRVRQAPQRSARHDDRDCMGNYRNYAQTMVDNEGSCTVRPPQDCSTVRFEPPAATRGGQHLENAHAVRLCPGGRAGVLDAPNTTAHGTVASTLRTAVQRVRRHSACLLQSRSPCALPRWR